MGNPCKNALQEPIPHPPDTLIVPINICSRKYNGFAKPDNTCNVFCPGSSFTFLGPAMDQVVNFHTFFDIESPDPFGSVEFVGREREKVYVLFLHVNLHVPDGLYG